MDETKLRQLWAEGATLKSMAIEFGCSRSLVSKRAQTLNLPRRITNTAILPGAAIVSAYVHHGKSMGEIRDQLRGKFPTLSQEAIRNLLVSRGVEIRKKGKANCWMSAVGAA
jgi:hypothetical protein